LMGNCGKRQYGGCAVPSENVWAGLEVKFHGLERNFPHGSGNGLRWTGSK
jgi:hypothetical protein